MRPTHASVTERLSSTLFVAALAHGIVILGVTFVADPLADDHAIPTLNVTLVVDTNQQTRADESPEWLAQRNQQGGGPVTDGLRPTTTLSAGQPLTQLGDPLGADLRDAAVAEPFPSAEQLMTRSESERELRALPRATESAADVPMRAAAMIENSSPQTLAAEIDLQAHSPGSENRERALIASPSTRESSVAAYLDAWRRRVERIGTINFPEQLRHSKAPGRPTLEVAINQAGELQDIVVRRSSGDRSLDQAALDILRMASPFEPLPETIRAEYDVLRFAYEWDFFTNEAISARADTTTP